MRRVKKAVSTIDLTSLLKRLAAALRDFYLVVSCEPSVEVSDTKNSLSINNSYLSKSLSFSLVLEC
jgi:hypothetical protein